MVESKAISKVDSTVAIFLRVSIFEKFIHDIFWNIKYTKLVSYSKVFRYITYENVFCSIVCDVKKYWVKVNNIDKMRNTLAHF